jgi:peptidoglycan/LPS O-acetylase OafA/YrhL
MEPPLASRRTGATPLAETEREILSSSALDQWRGLALILVLISHGFFFTNRVNGLGRVGVNLFFFISGILVFRSLARTQATTAAGLVKSFWWRRLRRLYPAMIAYILILLPVVWWFQHQPNLPPDNDFVSYLKGIFAACTYTLNYFGAARSLGHLWSLACEMQFYFIAPLIFLLGGATVRRRNWVFGTVLLVLLGLGLAQPFIGKWKYHFEFAVWPMMLGFFCEHQRGWFQNISRPLVTGLLWASALLGLASFGVLIFFNDLKPLVVATGALLLLPCLLAYLFGRPLAGVVGRALQWLGERTYSIYLWQEPFTIDNYLPALWQPAGALVSVAVGALWFRWFERPFLSASRKK